MRQADLEQGKDRGMGLRLDAHAHARLEDLARATRRSKGEVLRLLIESAPMPERPDVTAGRRWWATGAAGCAGQEVQHGRNGSGQLG